eukprot:g38508.t1
MSQHQASTPNPAGVDPKSRRLIWDLLMRKKAGRVIVLTTHFMDEADQVGDRIGIMDRGRLQCVGSALFLKHLYGVGYSLTCLLQPSHPVIPNSNNNNDYFSPPAVYHNLDRKAHLAPPAKTSVPDNHNFISHPEHPGWGKRGIGKGPISGPALKLSKLVRDCVPEATVASSAAAEVAFSLPLAASALVANLLHQLESQSQQLGLASYGLSVTTLEEVFLKVALEGDGPANLEWSVRREMELERSATNGWVMTESNQDHDAWLLTESTQNIQGTCPRPPSPLSSPSGQDAGVVSTSISSSPACPGMPQPRGARSPFSQSILGELLKTEPTQEGAAVDLSTLRHLQALVKKRFDHTKRDKKAWLCVYLLPLVLITLGMGFLKFPLTGLFPYLELSTAQYNSPLYVPCSSDVSELLAGGVDENFVLSPLLDEDNREIQSLQGFSERLLSTMTTYETSRYGAFFQYPNGVKYPKDGFELYIYSNITAPHALPSYLNVAHTALLRKTTGNQQAKITAGTRAFDPTYSEAQGVQAVNGAFASVIISLAFSFIPASFAAFVVMEREIKSKHLQILAGVHPVTYWASHFIWDFLNFAFTASICLVVLKIYDNPSLTREGNFGIVCSTIFLFGLSVIPFTYCLSFLFSTSSTAQAVMILVYITGGIVLVVLNGIFYLIPQFRDVNDKYIRFIFRLHPSYCLGDAIFYMCLNDMAQGYFASSNWDPVVAGDDLHFLAFEPIGYFLLTLILEQLLYRPNSLVHFLKKIPLPAYARRLRRRWLRAPRMEPDPEEDEDVRAERERIRMGGARKNAIVLEGLRKVFDGKEAVRDLWFAVPPGECFGFLGGNGAGKTTTMRMVTGDENPTAGRALIQGLDLAENPQAVRAKIGYCPQFDALHSNLTAVETLTFYGRVRGVPEDRLQDMVTHLIDRLNLTLYAGRPVGTYSGGNKRKLSVAIALLGDPPAVFLDEPSTGIDPVSRRFMWNFINETMEGRAVVLTSHSMEECEALCTRIGILASGSLRCLGTAQHLKGRFGKALQVEVSSGHRRIEPVRRWMRTAFPDAKEIEAYGSKAKYKLSFQAVTDTMGTMGHVGGRAVTDTMGTMGHLAPQTEKEPPRRSLADVFATLEGHKDQVGITEFSVGQTTLEQVFIAFSRQDDARQEAERELKQKQAAQAGLWSDCWLTRRLPTFFSRKRSESNDITQKLLPQ